MCREWRHRGSLRDIIYGSPPGIAAQYKYAGTGRPLSDAKCARYGAQLLGALEVLEGLGDGAVLQVHCGNLFISGERVVVAEWEAGLLGAPSALEPFCRALRAEMTPGYVALAHALYEMCCGFEADVAAPSFFPPHAAPRTADALRSIFAPRTRVPGRARPPPRGLGDAASLPLLSRALAREPLSQSAPAEREMREIARLIAPGGSLAGESNA